MSYSRTLLVFLGSAGWLLGAPSLARAAANSDWYVDVGFAGCASGDGSQAAPFCDIADAIAAASDGDTIHVAAGTYAEHLVVGKDLTLIGTDGRDATIVDGTRNGRPLEVLGGSVVDVRGFTLTNGLRFPGSGVLVGAGARLTLTRSAVSANGDSSDEANGGGGIAVLAGAALDLADTLVEDNFAVYEGGGIAIGDSAVVTLTRCGVNRNFTGFDNFGGVGAGIFNDRGALSIAGSSICENAANRFGDPSRGGGIYSAGGSLSVTDTRICDNSVFSYYSAGTGAGVHSDTASASFEDVLISGNAAASMMSPSLGAGIYFQKSATFARSTVAGNFASEGGGAFVDPAATVTFGHAILAGNTSSSATSPDCDGVLTSAGYNLVGDTTGCVVTGDPTGNQLDVDPMFVDPSSGDFRLASGSPAIEAGDPALLPDGRDAGGQPRLLDGDLDRDMVIDLGGLERSHVTLAVSGDPSPGGTVVLDSTGTAGLTLFLLVGSAPGDERFRPFGRIFFSLAAPWIIVPFGTIPSSVSVTVPSSLPSGTEVILQDLAFDPASRAGNLSNPVDLLIE